MPETADFIAEVQKPDGSTMTMAIAVEGENVVAYATNGTNNETYFFGTQKDGHRAEVRGDTGRGPGRHVHRRARQLAGNMDSPSQ